MKSPQSRVLACVLSLLTVASFVHLSLGAQYDQRLINISTRARVGSGDNNSIIAGFVIGEGAPKQILIRAVGPSLVQPGFGLTTAQVLANPRIEVYDNTNTKVLENDNWGAVAADVPTLTEKFNSVGAFRFLSNGSADAALIATLSPGSYTVKVNGAGTTTGIALVEVYDLTGAAQLLNLSTRAEVQTGANIVIAGLVVAPGGGTRKVLVRAAGPALAEFGVGNILANPTLAITDNKGVMLASNDNWGDAGKSASIASASASSGAFAFKNASSLDSALVVDLAPGAYSLQVSGVGGTSGVALIEAYDMTPATLALISVLASAPSTDTAGGSPGVFTISRTGSTEQAVTVLYTVVGSAVGGVDFVNIPGSVTIPAGASSTTVEIKPYATTTQNSTASKAVTLTLAASNLYGVGGNSSASVTIFYNPGSLYISTLRPSAAAAQSVAYGTSSLQLSSDNSFALVSLSFAALTSPQTVAYLRLGSVNDSGAPYLFRIANGQTTGAQWDITDLGQYSAAEIVNAVKEGRVFVSIETADYPAGELAGSFLKSSGSTVFTAPLPPPAVNLATPTASEASRFLTQAAFGSTQGDIDAVVSKGYQAWITDQIGKTAPSQRAMVMADFAANNAGGQDRDAVTQLNRRPGQQHRLNAWWRVAVQGDDQLRQRVAFALSQIFVISDQNGTVNAWQEGAANYYDLLAKGAFGNFRQLLQDVTLSPMMGIYLTALRNNKANGNNLPDENYAREVMQLFSIGLYELNPDGTLRLDAQGLPIPTYDQTTIAETAKVFTGWGYAQSYAATPTFNGGGNYRGGAPNAPDYLDPMRLFPANHENGAKLILGGKRLPENQGGLKDLNDTLDALFNHANTGPFISRLLIQRLVTSNPSPAYVYRVAEKFLNNGAGVRGDLGAVVRAILTDYEARTAQAASVITFGKLKEPILRTAAVLRGLGGVTNSGRYLITNSNAQLSQMPLSAPTVFNFYEPDYVQPGALAAAGLHAPEFQIFTDTTAITVPNYLYGYLYASKPADLTNGTTVYLNISDLLPLATTPTALVDRLDLLLAGASTSTTSKSRISAALTAMPTATSTTEKVRSAAYLLLSTPEGAIQP